MAVQSVMDQNDHQFHLEEGERCRHNCDMMASMLSSIQKYHQEAQSGEGTYTMEGRFDNVDKVLEPMSQAVFFQDDNGSENSFDILEDPQMGLLGQKGMDQIVYSDVDKVHSGTCGSYLRDGTLIQRVSESSQRSGISR